MLRRFQTKLGKEMVVLKPGEYFVTGDDLVIATVLGSCISVCLRDPETGIGAMNHFMLPKAHKAKDVLNSQSARYGMFAMELIIGDMIKLGSGRENLTAKVFGGGHVMGALSGGASSVPQANINFVRSFLDMEGIKVLATDLGGEHGRKVLYLPRQGKVFVKKLIPGRKSPLLAREQRYQEVIQREAEQENVTFFE